MRRAFIATRNGAWESCHARGVYVRHVLAEAVVLVTDLVSQLSGVAHNNDGDLSVHRLDLLKGSENKDCSLS